MSTASAGKSGASIRRGAWIAGLLCAASGAWAAPDWDYFQYKVKNDSNVDGWYLTLKFDRNPGWGQSVNLGRERETGLQRIEFSGVATNTTIAKNGGLDNGFAAFRFNKDVLQTNITKIEVKNLDGVTRDITKAKVQMKAEEKKDTPSVDFVITNLDDDVLYFRNMRVNGNIPSSLFGEDPGLVSAMLATDLHVGYTLSGINVPDFSLEPGANMRVTYDGFTWGTYLVANVDIGRTYGVTDVNYGYATPAPAPGGLVALAVGGIVASRRRRG